MKKIGIFLDEINNVDVTADQKFAKLGYNTGNMLFWRSLKTLLELDVKSRWCMTDISRLDLDEYSAFVTTDLIWIRQMQEFSYLNDLLDAIGDLPLIPISIGLQSDDFVSDFKLHPETVKLLERISERCVMGVRGFYTAEILNKHGIKNFSIIGCPSMYMKAPGLLTVRNFKWRVKNVSVNFETFYGKLSLKRQDFLEYGAKNGYDFVEQTQQGLERKQIRDLKKFETIGQWLTEKSRCFFDVDQWLEYMRKFDFSMGMRFHGNVAALWENVPALYIVSDSRTRELCDHFSLPTLNIKAFDKTRPIRYYYRLADYSEFHKNYPARLNEWNQFLKVNSLETK